jgi:thymidylate synthase
MRQYLELMQHVIDYGFQKTDRTGIGTLSIFGHQMRFDLNDGFPLVTTKKCHLKSIIHELLWFIRGDTNVRYLHKYGVSIWDEWADVNGNLGPIYGQQWRSWMSADGQKIDQLQQVIKQIIDTPDSHSILLSRSRNTASKAFSHHNGLTHCQELKVLKISRQMPGQLIILANNSILSHSHQDRKTH